MGDRGTPYVPSFAGIIRFSEDGSKVKIDPETLIILIIGFSAFIIFLHMIY